jgi:hypothetical protein
MKALGPLAAAAMIVMASAPALGAEPPAFGADPGAAATVPDFGGPWMSSHARKFIAVGNGPVPVMDHPEHPHQARARGPDGVDIGTTAWVGDWNNLNLKPQIADAVRKAGEDDLAGFAHPTAESSCWPPGVPNIMNFFEPAYFIQSPGEVTILYQRGPNVRHVYLDRGHSAEITPSWFGESIGHYEGDTLVIDTIGFNDRTVLDRYMTPHSGQLHVVERYQRLGNSDDPDREAQGDAYVFTGETLQVDFTIEDPNSFEQPWSARATYRHVNRDGLEEVICAENNVDLFSGEEFPIPVADRREF